MVWGIFGVTGIMKRTTLQPTSLPGRSSFAAKNCIIITNAYPSSARLSSRRWEFDLGWFYIRGLEMLRLATVRRVAPRPTIDQSKSVIDLDTVKAIIRSRLHVMEHYASGVIKPVHKAEVAMAEKSIGRKLKSARSALISFDGLMDDVQRRRLSIALNASERLKTVYEFRNSLQAIWQRAGASHDKLCQELQDWCSRAEATGIQSLQDFSQRLRGYSLALS